MDFQHTVAVARLDGLGFRVPREFHDASKVSEEDLGAVVVGLVFGFPGRLTPPGDFQ